MFGILLALGTAAIGQTAEARTMEWTINGAQRRALVYAPSRSAPGPHPLVFGFHGHGGNMNHAARSFQIHRHWPEAVVVYMQGLPTPGKFDPKGERPGWQRLPGDQEDRDLRFFDQALATLKKEYSIDDRRIYATGHSNGGAFTYLLWGSRGELFAAFAPSAAPAFGSLRLLKPKPALHVAGEQDTIVPFENQKRSIEAVKKINGCDEQGKEWEKGCTWFNSSKNAPLVTFIHPGDHRYPAEAPAIIVKFFKEQVRP